MKLAESSNPKITKESDEMKLQESSNPKINTELEELKSPDSSNPKIATTGSRNQVCRFCHKFANILQNSVEILQICNKFR